MKEAQNPAFDMQAHGDGRVTLGGGMPALCRVVDRHVRALARENGARELSCPALIERAVLERAGYFEAFPEGATVVGDGRYLLQPAACYHCYARLAGMETGPTALTLAGRCYRLHEASFTGATRLWEFTMREVVVVGDSRWIEAERRQWIDRAAGLARTLGLEVTVEPATDPFFGAASRGRRLMQQLKELKHEVRARIGHETVALASINLHETFFGQRFDVRLTGGGPAHSACAAFGLERWAAAVLAQRGAEFAAQLVDGEF